MFGLGFGELLIILVIVLLVFGAAKLPQIGDALGRSIRNFKRASAGGTEIEVAKQKEIEGKKPTKRVAEADDDGDEVEEAEVVPAKKRKSDT